MRRGLSCTGFTTVEVLVVLLIIALLATITLPVFTGRNRDSEIAADARKIQRLFTTARSYALGNNGYYSATFSLDLQSYWIDQTDSFGAVVQPKVTTPEKVNGLVVIEDIDAPSGLFSAGQVSIRFYPQGNSDDATIHLRRASGGSADPAQFFTIKLYGPTGRADVLENQRS